jgi:NRPS condensation-like uncharacterized protein
MNTMKAGFFGIGNYPFGSLFLKGLPFAWSRKLLDQSLTLLHKTGNATPVLSNAGIIDSEQLVFGDVTVNDACLIGATLFPPALAMAISSFGESLTLSISFFESAIKKSVVERFFDRIEYELPG